MLIPMGKVRLIVLDVLKPHKPSILDIASSLSDLPAIDGVDIVVYEIDSKVENIKITIQGSSINFEEVKSIIEEYGATIHSLDKVACGRELVEEAQTHQDSPA